MFLMSHGAGYFNGLLLLEQIDSKYAVDVWYHTHPNYKKWNFTIGREGGDQLIPYLTSPRFSSGIDD